MTRPILSALLLTLSCATSALAAPPAPAANDAKPAIDVLKRYSPKSEPKATSNGNGATLVVHNIGAGAQEEDILFVYTITGHFRYFPDRLTARSIRGGSS